MDIIRCNEKNIKEVYNLICELKNKEFDFEKFKIAYNSKVSDKKNYYILGRENNTIIGFLSLVIDYQLHHADKVATIEELIVSERYRSKGTGKKLLENAIKYAKEKDCDVIELTSGFSRDKAHKFYENNGFIKGSYKFKMKL